MARLFDRIKTRFQNIDFSNPLTWFVMIAVPIYFYYFVLFIETDFIIRMVRSTSDGKYLDWLENRSFPFFLSFWFFISLTLFLTYFIVWIPMKKNLYKLMQTVFVFSNFGLIVYLYFPEDNFFEAHKMSLTLGGKTFILGTFFHISFLLFIWRKHIFPSKY